MKQTLILLCILLRSFLFAQKHDYIWLSGAYNIADDSATNFAIDFNTIPPNIAKVDGKLVMSYTNISIADKSGLLAFYSNGCLIKNKELGIMQGGGDLNGGSGDPAYKQFCPNPFGYYRIPQGIFSLPLGDQTHRVFHLHADITPSGPNSVCLIDALLLTQVDMIANQGLGAVVFKDSVLLQGCLQTACANRHANGRDWWVLVADNTHHRFYRFLSTPGGVQGPWVQDLYNPTTQDTFFYFGWSEFSPNGEHLMINDVHSGTAIYDFDRCSGLLSNLRYIHPDTSADNNWPNGWGAAFSPDSRFVYLVKTAFSRIDQFDLHSPGLEASRVNVAQWDSVYYIQQPSGTYLQTGFSYFQHGPDGKLYNWAAGTPYMHVMDFPNRKGADCGLRQRAIHLPYWTFAPNAYYPNYRLGPIDGSACDTLGIDNRPVALFRYDLEDTLAPLRLTFTDLSYYEPTEWFWDFGDGTTSADTSPVHLFPTAGVYTVCLTVRNGNAGDTYCRQVPVGTVGVSDLPVLPRVAVYPNPFADYLTVEQPALTRRIPHFTLTDALGRRVLERALPDFTERLDLRVLPAGVYFWQYRLGGQTVQSGRVVKQ